MQPKGYILNTVSLVGLGNGKKKRQNHLLLPVKIKLQMPLFSGQNKLKIS